MAVEYCNLTTDLADAFSQIEEYKNLKTLSKWELDTGNIYRLDQSGFIEMVFEDGVKMTAGSNTSPSAGEYYYDSTVDALYVRLSGSDSPSDHEMTGSADWSTLKTRCRNDAQEMLESLLRSKFAVPFEKIVSPGQSYNSRDYDYIIRRATALLTCSLIVKRTNPDDPNIRTLLIEVDNPKVQGIISDDAPGIIQRIMSGEIALRTQLTAREAGGFNVHEGIGNAATAFAKFTGDYVGSQREVWKLVIDTAGAPGTATWKLSYDDGGTYDYTLEETRRASSDDRRVSLGSGIYVEFVGTFVEDDEWTIELWPSTDKVTSTGIESIRLSR